MRIPIDALIQSLSGGSEAGARAEEPYLANPTLDWPLAPRTRGGNHKVTLGAVVRFPAASVEGAAAAPQ